MGAILSDFESMWARPRAAGQVGVERRLPPPAVRLGRAGVHRAGSSRSAPPAAWRSSPTATATWSAWWRPVRRGRARRASPGPTSTRCIDGGAYDGPLGVVSALAADRPAARPGLRAGRSRSGSSVFVEEEGSRFGIACLGSRLATGLTLGTRRGRSPRPGRRLPARRDGGSRAWSRTSDRRRCSTASAASSSCTSSRAATWCTARRAVGVAVGDLAARPLPLRLHRARPTTPAAPGWRTGATRCSPTR